MGRFWLALATGMLASAALSQQPALTSAEQAERAARLATFRAFAEPYVGEWAASIEDFDAEGKLVWSDKQRRIFEFSMSRHFLEERAILKRPDGTDYEGGLHLTTWDPQSDRIVQHGFWLPRQPEPLFRVEGRAKGRHFDGELSIREQDGTLSRKAFTMRWTGPDRWVLETVEKRVDGSTFISSRINYVKTS